MLHGDDDIHFEYEPTTSPTDLYTLGKEQVIIVQISENF